jgi:hypothetical protein
LTALSRVIKEVFAAEPLEPRWWQVDRRSRSTAFWIVFGLVALLVTAYWTEVGLKTHKSPNYMSAEAQSFLETPGWALLGPVHVTDATGKWGDYTIFAPTGFNLAAALDRFIVAPMVLGAHFDRTAFTTASRLLFAHALGIALATLAVLVLLWRTHVPPASLAPTLIYFGLNDGYVHALQFVGTLGLYTMLLGAIVASAGLFQVMVRGPSRGAHIAVTAGLVFAVSAHGQSAALPCALMGASIVAALLWRIPVANLRVAGFYLPVLALALYFAMRLGIGLSETSKVTESQYIFTYPSFLLMVEEIVVNISYHVANTLDSVVMPWPMFSVAIMQKIDMNTYNQYNLVYSPWPNMHYRLLSQWYVGLIFGLALWWAVWMVRRLVASAPNPIVVLALLGFSLFWLGFLMHIPVMHRDYFEQPGFNVGYKSVLSILGFALTIPFMVDRAFASSTLRARPRARFATTSIVCLWFVACAVGKIVFQPSYYYSW